MAAKSGAYEVGIGDGWMDGGTPSIGVRQTLEASTIYGDAYLLIDGARQNMTTSDKPSATHSTNTLHLLNINGGEAWVGMASCRLYKVKIYDQKSALSRDFIPCKAPSGAIGLYDFVSKQFYGNSGTGAFTLGPEIAPDVPSEPAPEPLDPYLWYDTDTPTAPQMAQYLANVAALRAVFTLPEETPQTPQSMALLTFARANDIERVLQAVESALERMALTFVACGTATVGGDYL